ncbi:MAG: YkoF family thiamine/hydroxymethylpyrimidine-binding protein [Woeseiaceae bacterium]
MQARADLSFYPLTEQYIPPIKATIDRLAAHTTLTVTTNEMSTQVTGDYDELMSALTAEFRYAFEHYGKSIFVMKLLPL